MDVEPCYVLAFYEIRSKMIPAPKVHTMADAVTLLSPRDIERNRDNPRLIFHQDELDSLEASIAEQGILVPLTVFKDGSSYFILDGERRWRCATKLGLTKVPAIVQPKPDRMTNIMMMFAIHKARKDWDPLPTANKLVELEDEFTRRNGRPPTESELAGVASLSRGEVRRLKKLLSIPESERELLMKELLKPRSRQEITADQVLEATRGAEALRKRGAVTKPQEAKLRAAIISKFRSKVIVNTVAPRKLARLARAVERNEVSKTEIDHVIEKLIDDPQFSIDNAFEQTVEHADFSHATEQLVERIDNRLVDHKQRRLKITSGLRDSLRKLQSTIDSFLR